MCNTHPAHLEIWGKACASRELEDFIPEIVALSADFVSSLFVAVCISTSSSLYLAAGFIIVDVGQSMLEFREVQDNANVLLSLHQERRQSKEYLGIKNPIKASESDSLLTTMLAVTRNPSSYNIRSLSSARLRACLPHPITQDQEKALNHLEDSGVYTSNTSRRSPSERKIRVSSAITVPEPSDITSKTGSESSEREQKSKQLVVQSLQLLFHCEYLVLVEYVECIVPLVYVIYKSVAEQLPNICYFPGGAGNWGVSAVVNVLISAILEIGSLVMLNIVLQRKFSFSPIYQLAFVLETQIMTVQTKLLITILVLLQYQLEHLGVDFSFRFQWLHQ
ncbi:uncharacterized protein PITG_13989 [Phytophthora infestans T30-4]|uniref:Transmembrane protein n=1 Tax=Phytophthora infestans (strain T30-4) TaxID=403677 RepID=D0NN97_PHYIT|nr:uncharacterized protein PITG_13989 [Phytophthora infestans T30-4]EEY62004.1 conserved hypothetical protein [Phytophthora infestans T30-4]|eukprot:XP_002899644.1 conserved hypothetical protein [Phytophthora infestans T30-4]